MVLDEKIVQNGEFYRWVIQDIMHIGSEYNPCKKTTCNFKTIEWIILNTKAEKLGVKNVVMLLRCYIVISTQFLC